MEQLVDLTADFGRSNFGKVQWNGLVAESDTDSEEDSADDEHGNVDCDGVDKAAKKEGDGSNENACSTAIVSGDVRSEEGGEETGEVERGSEESEDLIVVFAVICFFDMKLFAVVDFWKELL